MQRPFPLIANVGFGLFPAGLLAPLFGARALKNGGAARWIVLTSFVPSAVLVAFMFGLGGIVTERNLGYFSRAVTLIAFPAMAYLSGTVLQRMREGS